MLRVDVVHHHQYQILAISFIQRLIEEMLPMHKSAAMLAEYGTQI